MARSIKHKLLKAKISLSHTIQKILDINRKRKKLSYLDNPHQQLEDLDIELKVLNKLAKHHVCLINKNELALNDENNDQQGRNQNLSHRI